MIDEEASDPSFQLWVEVQKAHERHQASLETCSEKLRANMHFQLDRAQIFQDAVAKALDRLAGRRQPLERWEVENAIAEMKAIQEARMQRLEAHDDPQVPDHLL